MPAGRHHPDQRNELTDYWHTGYAITISGSQRRRSRRNIATETYRSRRHDRGDGDPAAVRVHGDSVSAVDWVNPHMSVPQQVDMPVVLLASARNLENSNRSKDASSTSNALVK